MLERGKMDQELAALAVIAQSAPTGHLLRKIDAAIEFNKRYEHIRASADTQYSGASGKLMRNWQTTSTGKGRAFGVPFARCGPAFLQFREIPGGNLHQIAASGKYDLQSGGRVVKIANIYDEILRWNPCGLGRGARGVRVYLRSLAVQGFKSFPDKTVIQFGDDITAIVGPNGSGKSNISDAIRWVMGEQSTKALRGAKMEDVIFGGTQKRAQVGFAEATLTLDNSDGSLPLDAREVMITRRYYRSGESEFYINKQSARLRDINELFMDTGLGREGYSNISQGRIDEILSLKSADRREIFEEAAGISKYRHRKEETEHRLAKTDENLLRIGDKITELELQVEPLRQQAEKAKKYLAYRDELKGLQVTLWLQQLDKLTATARKAEQDFTSANFILRQEHDALDALYRKAESLQQALQQRDLALEAQRGAVGAQESALQQLAGQISVLRSQAENTASNIDRIAEEISAHEARAGGIESQIAQRQQHVKDLAAQADAQRQALAKTEASYAAAVASAGGLAQRNLTLRSAQADRQARQAGLQADYNAAEAQRQQLSETRAQQASDSAAAAGRLAQAQAQATACADALEKGRAAVLATKNALAGYELRRTSRQAKRQQLQEQYDAQRVQCSTLQAQVKLYEDMERAYKGFSEAVRTVMHQRDQGVLHNVYGTVAQLIRTEDDYTVAIETALGGGMQHMLVATQADAKAAMQLLKRQNSGRATFLPVDTMQGSLLREQGLDQTPGFLGIAADLITYDPRFTGVMRYLLGRIVVMRDLTSAIAAANRFHHRFKLVTLDGQVMNAGGSMTGGSVARSAGFLTRANELSRLRQRLEEMTANQQNLDRQLREAIRAAEEAAFECETASGQLRQQEDEVLRLTGEQQQHKVLLDAITAAMASAQREAAAAQTQFDACDAKCAALRAQLDTLSQEIAAGAADLAQAGADEAAASDESAKTSDEILRLKLAISALDTEGTTQRDAIAQLTQLQAQLQGDRAEKEKLLSQYQAQLQAQNASCADLEGKHAADQEALAAARQALQAELQARKAMEEQKTKAERGAQEKNKDILNMERECARLEQKKLSAELEEKQIIDKLWDTYQLTRSTAPDAGAEIESPAAAQRRIAELKRKLGQLGTPNLGAVEEFDRVNERYQYLSEQRDDVVHAKNDLLAVIKDITTQMTEIFTTEFAKINTYFGQTFTEMFGGGKASLSLDDPSQPLACGIEINVQPPGKQLKTITLLSGGEKAFVAIALYFAILKVRPTPFCMLDEIDAALDDRNVERFANYLRTFCNKTQFIVVTHRRGTMEAADVLYGVTMQEQGVSKILHLDLNQMEQILKLEKK